jgi:hypothetical protein
MRRGERVGIALAVGVVAGGLPLWLRLSGRSIFFDFDQIWIAAHAVLRGADPYAAVAHGFTMPFYYPLPAAIVGVPFAAFPIAWAGPIFVGAGFAALAYGLLGRGPWALIGLASWPALQAAQQCQWSPVLAAAALLPWLGWLTAAKPTTGAIATGAYFSRPWVVLNVVFGALLVALAFTLWPGWFLEWLAALRGARHFVPLILRPGGIVLLLSILRWRRPEARLLGFSAIVPQTGAAYDALLLALVPSNRREALAFGLVSFATIPFLAPQAGSGDVFVRALAHNQTVYLVMIYLPALALVLLRRNDPIAARARGTIQSAPSTVRDA